MIKFRQANYVLQVRRKKELNDFDEIEHNVKTKDD